MKRFAVFAASLVLAAWTVNAYQISIGTYVSNAGKTVTVPVALDSAAGLSYASATLTYDPQVLVVAKAEAGTLRSLMAEDFVATGTNGTLTVSIFGSIDANVASGSGTIANVTFAVRGGTEGLYSDIAVAEVELGEKSGVKDVGADNPITTVNGMVRVVGERAAVARLDAAQMICSDTAVGTLMLKDGDAIQASDARTAITVVGSASSEADRILVRAPDGGWTGGRYALLSTTTPGLSFALDGMEGTMSSEVVNGVTTYYATLAQAANDWTVEPSITGWIYGQTPSETNMGTTKFGEVEVVYCDAGGGALGTERPTGPGEYLAVFTVAETANWSGLTKEVAFTIRLPGEGAVTTPKSWKSGQKVTWKAKAAKGSVFAHWEGELVDSLVLSRNELRNPSLAFTVPKGFDASQITAVFIALDDDGLSKLSFVDGEGEPMGDEGVIFFELKADVGEFWLADDSESYVTASVSGLPSGLKFDKKTLRITGTPTKSGAYWVQIKAKNASGYQWAEKVKMVVPGYTTEPKEPKLTQTAYYPLTVISSDTAVGTVSGTGVYAEGKKVSISAKPSKGLVFAGWYRDAALTEPMQFASGDYRKASQSVVVPEVRYLFARFVAATPAADPVEGLAAVGSGLTGESKFSWRVGVAVPEDDGVEYKSASLPSASAAKLPSGVKFDAAKGRFTGVPTKAGSYPATVTVKNASKATAMLTLTIDVAALDEWAQGTFNGATLLGGGFIETALPSGLVTFTVDAKGKISGKILEGGKTWSLSAVSFSRVEHVERVGNGLAYYATVVAKSGKEVATNEIAIVAEETGAAAVSSKPPYRGFATGTLNPIPHTPDPKPYLSAWQNLWKVEPWKTEMKDYAKANPTRTEEVEGGTITLKLAASGAVTAKGDFVVGYDAVKQKNIVYSSSCSTVVISAEGGYMVYIYFPANEKKKFGGYSGVIWLK